MSTDEPAVERNDCVKDDKPVAKKAKTNDSLSQISPSILLKQKDFAKEYVSNQPFPHVIFPDVFQEDFFRSVFDEIKRNSSMTFKESDLFKFYQSIDLANLKSEGPVMQLRNILYGSEWRAYMEKVADLPPNTLADRVDCACNCHTTGCHLLCHDDVITTRCLSYILYLTEENWDSNEGGALELFPSKETGSTKVPDVSPSAVHLPLRNHLAMFKVEPGLSFHAVQEVLGSRPRLSLQGWYHYRDPSTMKHLHTPTLQLLKQKGGDSEHEDEAMPWPYRPVGQSLEMGTTTLSEKDVEFLSKYLDETYLRTAEIDQIKQAFQEESAVQLQNFFRSDLIPSKSALRIDDSLLNDSSYSRGASENWRLVGPPHKQRFLEWVGDELAAEENVGAILSKLKQELLESPAFGRWLAAATNLPPPIAYRGKTRRFRRGLDYTVAHHGLLLGADDPAVLDATVCFVDEEEPNEDTNVEITTDEGDEKLGAEEEGDVSWKSGNVGGFECYIEAEEDGIDEEYVINDEEDNTELLSVSPSNNTLSLVLRDTGTMRFVKFVSARAPSSRWDIAMEYQVPDEIKEETANDEKAKEDPAKGKLIMEDVVKEEVEEEDLEGRNKDEVGNVVENEGEAEIIEVVDVEEDELEDELERNAAEGGEVDDVEVDLE